MLSCTSIQNQIQFSNNNFYNIRYTSRFLYSAIGKPGFFFHTCREAAQEGVVQELSRVTAREAATSGLNIQGTPNASYGVIEKARARQAHNVVNRSTIAYTHAMTNMLYSL